MTDLTVLVSPMPLYPMTKGFVFGRSKSPALPRPIMVTLETEADPDDDSQNQAGDESASSSHPHSDPPPRRSRRRSSGDTDPALLSPPVNTWKSPRTRPGHRPTRSQSAPPERRTSPDPRSENRDSLPAGTTLQLQRPHQTRTTSFAAGKVPGELVRPPPPLFRPTTFWRKTRRSGVTGASYSPSSHLIRRSTYIAAGLPFDAPVHDLSALCVESRVGFIVVPAPDFQLL
ncbi:hypothetical protein K443DRAFT_130829 [Laccaria amethystina LaAM-08-1]|uniref:Uncharacterized protein n=1 Tax=Laccaria amethystina LaAM-08-1 TaxID=1095629 RepID=A0A0C9WXM1_9AGAR|nr:hypothetical protein K443DRAFT_130829 [Laccaria amethystina LaAM-08-1]